VSRLVRLRRSPFGALLAVALAFALTFLAIPLVALFAEVPLRRLPTLLGDPVVRDALDA
jgi:molybdate transport system permease protein